MPDIASVSSFSGSGLAEQASRLILSRVRPLLAAADSSSKSPALWSLHSVPSTGMPWQSKIKPLEKRILSHLYSSSISKFGRRSDTWKGKPGDVLVQCFMKDVSTVAISVTELSKSPFFWRRPLPWLAGHIAIPEDPKYPAESYKKCKEILCHMGIDHHNGLEGRRVVELGAMPGGWTMVLLEAGANLTSVDWAQLENPWLTSHPRLNHRCEDARIFDPRAAGILDSSSSSSVDYLFADLALPPEKSLVALEQWIQNRWTKAFAWTFKFGFHTGDKYHDIVNKVRRTLAAHGPDLAFSLRHIHKHENEMVVLGGWSSMAMEGLEEEVSALPRTSWHDKAPESSA